MGRASQDARSHLRDEGAAHAVGDGQVVIGLGGNLGQVARQFCAAVTQLDLMYTVCAVSALYRTMPVGPPQSPFLNAAVLVSGARDLHLLLNRLHELEAAAGRERGERWGPRTLDLDVLWAGSNVVRDSALTVPHAALRERRFALLPLLDLVPDATDPTDGTRYAALARDLETQGVEVLARDTWWRRAM
ncbi:MAG TPA: 2-amino-4-hydroxy-6-hydroxymethyldihydropteridine diphosphokinase [Polyangiaceae bacterium]|nr:2-amino-4-hydroxy-6-hydroxymethyldihydropteridine diphosphokinase [Polyangiaceae bacterium]